MTCNKCHGRGFYEDNEIADGSKHLVKCDHDPEEKYRRMHETFKRINENWSKLEEENRNGK